MHFAKTYSQLLLSLPPELSENAIQYRQLKKLINQLIQELSSLGLGPAVLQQLLEHSNDEVEVIEGQYKGDATFSVRPNLPKITYEADSISGRTEPRLRLWLDSPIFPADSEGSTPGLHFTISDAEKLVGDAIDRSNIGLLRVLQQGPWVLARGSPQQNTALVVEPSPGYISEGPTSNDTTRPAPNPATRDGEVLHELVIPLVSDTAFFQLLSLAIHHISAHMIVLQSNFVNTLHDLSSAIRNSARPASSVSRSFHPFSATSNAATVGVSSGVRGSDLYTWREIFRVYIETEIFESVHEIQRGERSVEESEHRLKLFVERVTRGGLGVRRKMKKMKKMRSWNALEKFLELNVFILNIKKFHFANAEATRKILKKHAKRTALPEPNALILSTQSTWLPHVLVQAIVETLLPVIPHLDDYTCLICTSIAFKPIRLNCGHLFCVRCLVKMQKRGKANCPMCRASTVLIADQTNVDWALMNFMQDWFPVESKLKLKENQKEANREQLEELGFDPDQKCVIV